MPKFNLYAIDIHPEGSQEYRCEVGWQRGDRVRLAVTRPVDGADPREEYLPPASAITSPMPATLTVPAATSTTGTPVSGWMRLTAAPGREATISGADGVQELVPTWQGWSMPLDREQINQLIRELRRARDVTYGKDQ